MKKWILLLAAALSSPALAAEYSVAPDTITLKCNAFAHLYNIAVQISDVKSTFMDLRAQFRDLATCKTRLAEHEEGLKKLADGGQWAKLQVDPYIGVWKIEPTPLPRSAQRIRDRQRGRLQAKKELSCEFLKDGAVGSRTLSVSGCSDGVFLSPVACEGPIGSFHTVIACSPKNSKNALDCYNETVSKAGSRPAGSPEKAHEEKVRGGQ